MQVQAPYRLWVTTARLLPARRPSTPSRRRGILPALLLGTLWMLCGPVSAADMSVAERLANQQSLRASVEAGQGKFARLDASNKTRLLRAQHTIFMVLEGKSDNSQLNRSEQTRIDSAETEIAKLVASLDPPAAKAKVVCSYEARIGSNRKERVCRKVDSGDSSLAREQVRKMQTR